MTLETYEVLEVAHIAAIMGIEVDFDKWYDIRNNGYIAATETLSEWALEFYLKYKDVHDTYWEEIRDEQGDWDNIIVTFMENKIKEYDKRRI